MQIYFQGRPQINSYTARVEGVAHGVYWGQKRGIKIIIAAAGGAAHLPGVTAALTSLPVLGVPMSSTLSGLDSLLSIVQMPSGIPVPTMSIGKAGSKNAGLFAIRMLSLSDKKIAVKLDQYIKNMANSVPTIPKDLK